MDIQLFREFIEIACCNSISDAARNLYMTHQTLSAHLKIIERELGHDLLVRGSAHGLTPLGVMFLEAANDIVGRYDLLRDRMRTYEKTQEGTVRFISYDTTPFISLLHETGTRVAEEYPLIKLEFVIDNDKSPQNLVLEDKVDIAFAAHIGSTPFPNEDFVQQFDFLELTAYRDDLYFIIPENSALFEINDLTLDKLMKEEFAVATYNNKSFLLESFEKFCFEQGFVPRTRYVSASNAAEFFLLFGGTSLLFCSGTYFNSLVYRDTILSSARVAHLQDRDYSMRAYAFWSKESRNPALPLVVEQLMQANEKVEGTINTSQAAV